MLQNQLKECLGKEVLLFDGAFGTQLQALGMKAGDVPEELNITNPKLVQSIHLSYLEAGAQVITTSSFGCNPWKMQESSYPFEELLQAAIDNAKAAKLAFGGDCYIALGIGPIGQLLQPMGTLSFDEAYELIAAQVRIAQDQVDLVLLETMTDLYEAKAGVLAVKENSDLPVFTTMTFEANGRTLAGCDPVSMVNVLEGLGVDALGVNCSLGPVELTPIIHEILECATVPVMVVPNAGLPHLVNGKTCFALEKEDFVREMIKHIEKGVAVVGGCCGTTPAFIKLLAESLPEKVTPRKVEKKTRVSSGNTTVTFGNHVVVCGERLNPTGKKKMKAALLEGAYETLVMEGIAQEQAGAHVLDVNVGLPGLDEATVMGEVIPLLQEVLTVPLQIDSSSAAAIEAGCRCYNGKPLINSVNGKTEVMESIFPIVQKYGGVVIGLTLDENGIPSKAQDRVAIAKKIIQTAAQYGIGKEDIIIDCLVLTASAQQAEVMETCEAVRQVKKLGVHTVLGVSNVSFGLPNRPLLNKTFLTMAMTCGLDLPIINPLDGELMDAISAFNVLRYYDVDAVDYIKQQGDKTLVTVTNTGKELSLTETILHGRKEEARVATKVALQDKSGLEVVNEVLIPALDQVGKMYDSGQLFLPQLIQSAEAAKVAFGLVKETFQDGTVSKGPIIMATVEGDIHDIGKNIVKVVLESYGYQVIDLGKDVPPAKVLEACRIHKPKAVGLSALMTTTVVSMEKTITLLKASGIRCPILVGGAVLSADYAKEIQADYYVADAMATVELLDHILHEEK